MIDDSHTRSAITVLILTSRRIISNARFVGPLLIWGMSTPTAIDKTIMPNMYMS